MNTLTESGEVVAGLQSDDGIEKCWGFTLDEVRQGQREDTDLKLVLEWMIDKSHPSERDLFLSSPATKFYWINKERLRLRDNVLFKKKNDSDIQDLVLPKGLRDNCNAFAQWSTLSRTPRHIENAPQDTGEVLLVRCYERCGTLRLNV